MNILKHINQRIGEMLEDESLHICGDAGVELEEIQTWCYQACQQRDAFVESVYELAFGDNAVNRDFTPDEALARLREFSDIAQMVEAWSHGLRQQTAHESRMVKAARAALVKINGNTEINQSNSVSASYENT